jgi:hypothetical protein
MPTVHLSLGQNPEILPLFTRMHPKYRVFAAKEWGVALLFVPDEFAIYLRGKARNVVRTNRNRARRSGFLFSAIDPLARLDDILSINTSTESRQGKPMLKEYSDRDALKCYFAGKQQDTYGVVDASGTVVAYCYVPVLGDVSVVSRVLGHTHFLEYGIMYLLLSELVREMSERKAAVGKPDWIMYDTCFGNLPGLRYFKDRMGFRPFRVKWSADQPASHLRAVGDCGATKR